MPVRHGIPVQIPARPTLSRFSPVAHSFAVTAVTAAPLITFAWQSLKKTFMMQLARNRGAWSSPPRSCGDCQQSDVASHTLAACCCSPRPIIGMNAHWTTLTRRRLLVVHGWPSGARVSRHPTADSQHSYGVDLTTRRFRAVRRCSTTHLSKWAIKKVH